MPDALLSSVKRKIAVRKENEALLKVIKKDLKKATRKVVKSGLLTEEDVIALLNYVVRAMDVSPWPTIWMTRRKALLCISSVAAVWRDFWVCRAGTVP